MINLDDGHRPTKPVHMTAKINMNGDVSALCFAAPRAINLAKATWTNRPHAVTCRKCKRKMVAAAAEAELARSHG